VNLAAIDHVLAAAVADGDVPNVIALAADRDGPVYEGAAGSGGWSGVQNTHFWVDRRSGLTGAIYTQTLPMLEPGALRAYTEFERARYATALPPAAAAGAALPARKELQVQAKTTLGRPLFPQLRRYQRYIRFALLISAANGCVETWSVFH